MGRTDYFDDPNAPRATGRAPGVVAAVRDESARLLMTRRADNGLWVLPGGRIELGETIAEAAVREVREETGVDIDVVGIAALHSDPGHVIAYDDGTTLQEFSITLHARSRGGSPRADLAETTEVRWFSVEELRTLDLHPAMRARVLHALDPEAPAHIG